MKWIIASLALVAAIELCSASMVPDLRGRWGVSINPLSWGKDSFIYMPHTATEASETTGWDLTTPPTNTMSKYMTMYSYENRQINLYYDADTGYVAGYMICFAKDNITSPAYDMEAQGHQSWTVETDGSDVEFWCASAFLVSEETMQTTVAERQVAADADIPLQEGKVWLTNQDGDLDEVVMTAEGLLSGGFTEQACIPTMGKHYYKNMSNSTECSASTLYPWFILTKDGEGIGVGHQAFLGMTSNGSGTYWFEDPTRSNVELIVSDGPTCLYELVDSYGVKTMHFYFVKRPYTIVTC